LCLSYFIFYFPPINFSLQDNKKIKGSIDVILYFYADLLFAKFLEVFSNVLAVLAAILENSFTSSFSRTNVLYASIFENNVLFAILVVATMLSAKLLIVLA